MLLSASGRLGYCAPGPDGVNPALTFSYSNCFFLPRDRVLADAAEHRPRFLEAWEKSAESRAHVAATFGHGDPDFVDILPVLFAPRHGPAQFGYFPQYSGFGPGERAPPSPAEAAAQLHLYATFVELGVVLSRRRPTRIRFAPAPKAERSGPRKRWRRDELTQASAYTITIEYLAIQCLTTPTLCQNSWVL